MYTLTELETHLVGMGHGGSLNKVRNRYALYERAANNMRSKVDVVTTIRSGSLSQAVHDEQAVYAVPSDFGKIIDLYPSGKRTSGDFGRLTDAVSASLLKQIRDKQIAIESRDGVRVLFIDWQGNKVPKTLAQMNSATGWSATAGAANVELDSLFAISGGRSVRFDLTATGGGIENTTSGAEYYVDTNTKTVTFVTPPGNLLTIEFYYGYSVPLAIASDDETSISAYTQHDVVEYKKYIKTRDDLLSYTTKELERRATPVLSGRIETNNLTLKAGQNVTVVDAVNAASGATAGTYYFTITINGVISPVLTLILS
jgi:hypothetical protein